MIVEARSIQSCIWCAPIFGGLEVKTYLHFFPVGKKSSGLVSVNCKVSLFGNGQRSQVIMLEGLAPGQPDGVDVSELFPRFEDKFGKIAGVKIELSAASSKARLDDSVCIIEVHSPGGVSQFQPRKLNELQKFRGEQAGPHLCMAEPGWQPSLIFLNAETTPEDIELESAGVGSDSQMRERKLSIPAMSVLIDQEFGKKSSRQESIALFEEEESLVNSASWARLSDGPPAFLSYSKQERVFPKSVQAL